MIIIIAASLRFYNLGSVPVSVDWDEAALAYNAYSILETGKDEYGEFLPVVLRSFNDYKPALYSYLALPAIKVIGLNAFAIRLPSAVFGLLSVIAVYFLVKEIFLVQYENKTKFSKEKLEFFSLLSAFLLAISPWHIQFSRAGFEANVGLALNIFMALFFLKAFKKPFFLSFSAFFSSLSIYSYQSEKLFTPLLIVILVLIYKKELFMLPKKQIMLAFCVGLISIGPMLFHMGTHPDVLSRARGSLLTSTQTTFLEENVKRLEIDRMRGDVLGLVFDNRRVLYFKSAVSGYLSHFDIKWLFITGDNARHHAPGMGLLYLWEMPFLIIGIYALLFHKNLIGENKKGRILLFAWFLVAPIPAAFTTDVPHAVRTLNFLPTFQIFTAAGILFAVDKALSIKYKVLRLKISFLLLMGYLIFIIFNILYYLNQYFVQMNYFYSKYWQYGRREEISFVKSIDSNYDKVIVSDKDFLDQSYIFYLYYLPYPPSQYQKEGRFFSDGKKDIRTFGKYEFRRLDWSNEIITDNTLFIGGPGEFGENVNILKTIYYLNGEEAVKIVGGKHE